MSKLQRREENLETVKAYEAKCVERHQKALAEAHEAEAQVEIAREAYVIEPTDTNAKSISVARERAELAQLRCQKPAQTLADARASVVAAEQALETARQEQIASERAAVVQAQVAYDASLNERLKPLWVKFFADYEALLEVARQIDSETQAVAQVSQALTLAGVPNLGRSPARIFEYPVKQLYERTTPTEQLVQDADVARVGGLLLPGGTPSRITPLVANPLFEFFLRYQGAPPSIGEQKRVHEFFERGCRPAQAPVEQPPQFPPQCEGTISHWLRDSDGTRIEILAETWSDGTRRLPARERELSERVLREEWSYAEAEVRRARLIKELPDMLPEPPNPNMDVRVSYITSGESRASSLL